ncbi:MAG: hypothetical protein WCV81_03870 [Microgenomates group bacterium]|jgi:hypothetical protein
MDGIKFSLQNLFNRFKKVILIVLTGVSGLLLTLAGMGLIQLTPILTLYSGIALLLMTVLLYLFM